jgi:hypothetical protein
MSAPDLDQTLEALAHLICTERVYHMDDPALRFNRNERRQAARWARNQPVSVTPQYFDGFELNAYDGSLPGMIARDANDLPIWPLDITVAIPFPFAQDDSEGHDPWPQGTWQFSRVRTLDPKLWRGWIAAVTPRMVEVGHMLTTPAGDCHASVNPYALINGRIKLARSKGAQNDHATGLGMDDPTQELRAFRSHIALSLRRYYLWSVLLGEGNGPRARFVTDPLGVREAFRLRDIPPGKKRRAALLHWVRAHWRQRRSISSDDRAWIDAYVRGVWSYSWNGLRCQIEPSIEDMNTLAARVPA